jgi:hypothetical protein
LTDGSTVVKAANPTATITLTGHSLGGGLAALIGVFFGETAMTFDQAPFAETAKFGAQELMNYLNSEVDTQGNRVYSDAQLSGLTNYIQLQQADVTLITPIPNQNLVTNINTQGEFLSTVPWNVLNKIGTSVDIPDNTSGISGDDLHSISLLTAYLQSNQSATTSAGQVQSLSEATYKLTDLLKMIFDEKLFSHRTDTDKENFIERLVRHEAGNAPCRTAAL